MPARSTPVLGPSVPRAGNAFTRALARGVLRLGGWRIEGEVPDEPKLVLVGAPHTTNLDFVLTKLTAGALGVRLSWVGKKSLFPGPLAWIGRGLGGIPVDRASSDGFVEAMAAEFRRRERFYLALMPAGSRATPDRWRSGFYYIARDADVPMLLVAFDWGRRAMRLGPVLRARPGAGYDDELALIRAGFDGVTGRSRRAAASAPMSGAPDVREPRAP
jgi:1-acyl-sn-glycerol-3-phosphate acyltransferase